ncbi:MAG TPA: Tol-Pal system beta propeller repeat protein TolB [Gammaproteobacteria bacterium]|nr:Tol-Pal system beta propeller repeat protein TolB [Gammaproteobacteria bacterium]
MHLKLSLVALCALVTGTAQAELRIVITEGVARAVPIAVVPFGWSGSADEPLDVAGVVAADLERSGRFAPMARGDMLERPTAGNDVDFGDWRLLGTDVIVIGRLIPESDDAYTIQFQVFDVFRGEQLLGFRLPSTGTALRASAHKVSDMIFEELTGIPGAFSTRIAYVSVEGSGPSRRYKLIVADADGENPSIITESPASILSPAWAPDGRRLAYVSFEGDASSIYVQTLRTGERLRVSAHAGVNGAPAFSPDGRSLAMTLSDPEGNLDIWVMNLASRELRRVTDSPAIDTEADWSADGDSLVFTSDRSGGPQVYRVRALGGQAKRLTFEGNYNARPRLSPASDEIAVVHNDRGSYRIALIDPVRNTLQVLTDGRLDESPSFAPNGNTIIYATREDGKGVLATVSVDGQVRQRIASDEGDVREPVWSPFPP